MAGRWFTKAELREGAPVIVIQEAQARRLFGRIDPIGKTIQAGGRPVQVIGILQPPANIFAPPGQEVGAVMPYQFVLHGYHIDKTNALFICVKPKPGVSVADAEDAVTIEMRSIRKLRPGDHDNFDLMSQDQILDTFTSITDIFFLVMLVLASVALMVGGIGVMAIMMVSVTARTREIGVRKALGATRRDIMLQFLIEAATLDRHRRVAGDRRGARRGARRDRPHEHRGGDALGADPAGRRGQRGDRADFRGDSGPAGGEDEPGGSAALRVALPTLHNRSTGAILRARWRGWPEWWRKL